MVTSLNTGKCAEILDHSKHLVVSKQTKKYLNVQPTYDLANALSGIYPTEMKTYICRKDCICTFIEALFVIVKICFQPDVLEQMNGQKEKLWYIHITEYYLATKCNYRYASQFGWISEKLFWMKILIGSIYIFIWNDKTVETEARLVIARAWRKRVWREWV